MPGLIRGMARTAVVAGTATAVSNRVSRRQAARWTEQAAASPPQPAPGVQDAAPAGPPAPAAPAVPAADDLTTQLQKLGDLHAQGILSDAEFAAAKAKLLDG
jgi:hypothetical protein